MWKKAASCFTGCTFTPDPCSMGGKVRTIKHTKIGRQVPLHWDQRCYFIILFLLWDRLREAFVMGCIPTMQQAITNPLCHLALLMFIKSNWLLALPGWQVCSHDPSLMHVSFIPSTRRYFLWLPVKYGKMNSSFKKKKTAIVMLIFKSSIKIKYRMKILTEVTGLKGRIHLFIYVSYLPIRMIKN